MRVILGIGNPGSEYDGTRHNLGFAVLDALASRHAAGHWRRQGPSQLFEYPRQPGTPPSEHGSTLLVKPLTYVNHSGDAALAVLSYFKITPLDLLVVVDDLTLQLGHLRLRAEGSAGGHNGLRDIEAKLGKAYPRLRLGMGPLPPGANQVGFVLGRFAPGERAEADTMLSRATACCEEWIVQGCGIACRFNGPNTPPAPRSKPEPRPPAPGSSGQKPPAGATPSPVSEASPGAAEPLPPSAG
jgi:PTH1 family peptidyl-tRNA hydrolase